MRIDKQAVGEVVCNAKGCEESCSVFKFEPRSDRGSVFKNRYYFKCPKHGRVGADGSQTITDYILDNAKFYGASRHEPVAEQVQQPKAEPVQVQAVQIKKVPEIPAREPVQPKQAEPVQVTKKAGWFGL
jgi:hypothetical protein